MVAHQAARLAARCDHDWLLLLATCPPNTADFVGNMADISGQIKMMAITVRSVGVADNIHSKQEEIRGVVQLL